jgi:hypothetical protein
MGKNDRINHQNEGKLLLFNGGNVAELPFSDNARTKWLGRGAPANCCTAFSFICATASAETVLCGDRRETPNNGHSYNATPIDNQLTIDCHSKNIPQCFLFDKVADGPIKVNQSSLERVL